MQTNIVNTKYEYSLATRMAAEVLGAGGILAYPTETVYGLGADFSTEAAIKKNIQLKEQD